MTDCVMCGKQVDPDAGEQVCGSRCLKAYRAGIAGFWCFAGLAVLLAIGALIHWLG